MVLAAFALMVTVGSNPAYKRDQFETYSACIAAGQAQAETLPENTADQPVHWDCVPEPGRRD